MYTQISLAIQTRGVGAFGALSPVTLTCLHMTNGISIAIVTIPMLAHSLFFLLIPDMYYWIISPIYLIVLNKAPRNMPVCNVIGVLLWHH